MTKLLYTIWALLLNVFDVPIFRTCFANVMEDEERESLLCGPPFSSIIFSCGIYIIVVNSTLFPRSFREPKMVFVILYEFLATLFLLEFALACIWTPIDVLISTSLPTGLCDLLKQRGVDDAVIAFFTNKVLTGIIIYIFAVTFFLLTLHVTDSVDYTILRDFGAMPFLTSVKETLWDKFQRELLFLNKEAKVCRCKARRRGRSRNRAK